MMRSKRFHLSVALLAMLIVSFWHWGLRAQVASYGDPEKSYFSPAEGAPGEEVKVCFDDIVWYRLCPSTLTQHFTPAKGHRIDTLYKVSMPQHVGRVPPKCRAFVIPMLEDRQLGEAKLTGHLSSVCLPTDHYMPIITPLPTLTIMVRKPRQSTDSNGFVAIR